MSKEEVLTRFIYEIGRCNTSTVDAYLALYAMHLYLKNEKGE